MRPGDRVWAGLILALLCLHAARAGADAPAPPRKSLQRDVDPVIAQGALAAEMAGAALSGLRLHACRDGVLEPVRFQIDEMDREGGDLILPDGPFPNACLANGRLDPWDVLVFMARDSGDRAPREAWPPGAHRGTEIEVLDPLTGGRGWVYLLDFGSAPPPSSTLPPYVRYDYDREEISSGRYTVSYIITGDGLHTTYYDRGTFPEAYGGNGTSIFDRLKIRLDIRMFFGAVALRFDEEKLRCNVMAWKAGPIRLVRRLEQYMKVPGGRKAMRVISDITYYETLNSCPITLNVPFRLDTVFSSAVIRIGTEYTRAAAGAVAMNSQNPQGVLVDGRMSAQERRFDPGLDRWRVIYGDFGSFLCRTVFPPELLAHVRITQGMLDDATVEAPPEREPGAYGFMYQDWDITDLPGGTYTLFLEFYFPARYGPGDERAFVDYLDCPLRLRSGAREAANLNRLVPAPGETYRKNRSYRATVKATQRFNRHRQQTVDAATP